MADGLTITKSEGRVLVMHLRGMLDGQTHEALYTAARAERDIVRASCLASNSRRI